MLTLYFLPLIYFSITLQKKLDEDLKRIKRRIENMSEEERNSPVDFRKLRDLIEKDYI